MLGSSFEETLLVNPSRVRPATADEVADLESELGCRMPTGYADVVQLPRHGDAALPVGPGLLGALDPIVSGSMLNRWAEGWTFEAYGHRVEAGPDSVPATDLAEAASRVEALGLHVHVVDLGDRRTYFLPAIGGRLSLFQPEDEDVVGSDLTHDEAADPEAVEVVIAALT